MIDDFRFYFQIDHVEKQSSSDSLMVFVSTRILDDKRTLFYEGVTRVEVTLIGIFPSPKDIAGAVHPTALRKRLALELKRYIKPQKKFLVEMV
ncbi:hypothetical protein [Jeotgalibacillus soli]|uniref:Uncharacterized protein n=1 Tax=Jeotgalibacillus soli TaxID=889306 RepID=A0A0C2V989_9BACL|nr:hypothetical protein [Jeotgalibacillus soli]KIL45502.1 hypothetical protein KP78_30460 [Jeotgalibacillus soli]